MASLYANGNMDEDSMNEAVASLEEVFADARTAVVAAYEGTAGPVADDRPIAEQAWWNTKKE
jgi:hypothetical protein